MLTTIKRYLAAYSVALTAGLDDIFRKYAIRPGDMLDARTEFLCDCLWHAFGHLDEFREDLAATNMKLSNAELRQEQWNHMAKACAECFANRVQLVWKTYDRAHLVRDKYVDDVVVPFVRDVITRMAVPCTRPWDAVAACQVEPDLAKALRDAYAFVNMSDAVRRKQYDDVAALTCVKLLMNPERTDIPWCRDETVADTYLELAAAVLSVEPVTYRTYMARHRKYEDGSFVVRAGSKIYRTRKAENQTDRKGGDEDDSD